MIQTTTSLLCIGTIRWLGSFLLLWSLAYKERAASSGTLHAVTNMESLQIGPVACVTQQRAYQKQLPLLQTLHKANVCTVVKTLEFSRKCLKETNKHYYGFLFQSLTLLPPFLPDSFRSLCPLHSSLLDLLRKSWIEKEWLWGGLARHHLRHQSVGCYLQERCG